MPYIEPSRRTVIDQAEYPSPLNAGELNYLITTTVLRSSCCEQCRKLELIGHCESYISHHGLRYQFINDVMGALDGASREFVRRAPPGPRADAVVKLLKSVADYVYDVIAAPYEDSKIKSNGDISYDTGD